MMLFLIEKKMNDNNEIFVKQNKTNKSNDIQLNI